MAAVYYGKTKAANVKLYSSATSKRAATTIPLSGTQLVITGRPENERYPVSIESMGETFEAESGWVNAQDIESGSLNLPQIRPSTSEGVLVSGEAVFDEEEEEYDEIPDDGENPDKSLDEVPEEALKVYEEYKSLKEKRLGLEKDVQDYRDNTRVAIQTGPFPYFGGQALSVEQLESYYETVIAVEWQKAAYWDKHGWVEVGLDAEYSAKEALYKQKLLALKDAMYRANKALSTGFSQEQLKGTSDEMKAFRAVVQALQDLKDTLNAYYYPCFVGKDWGEWYKKQEAQLHLLQIEEQKKWDEYEEAKEKKKVEQTTSQQVEDAPEQDAYMESEFSEYNSLGDFAKQALQVEKLLNPVVILRNRLHRQANNTTDPEEKQKLNQAIPRHMKEGLEQREKEIIKILTFLTQALKQKMTYVASLQAARLLHTAEYELIAAFGTKDLQGAGKTFEKAFKDHQPTDIKLSLLEERKDREMAQLHLIHNEIIQIWNIPFDQFQMQWSNLQIARHGTSKVSSLATWAQKEGTCGELILCKPLMKLINTIAAQDQVIYQRKAQEKIVALWKPDQVIIQILVGSTRRYKLLTIYESMMSIHTCKDALLRRVDEGRIVPGAWTALQQCLEDYIIGGVSKKAKEQVRQITTLLHLLNTKQGVTCIGYEVPFSKAFGSNICADILLKDANQPQLLVIEIESLPTTERQQAYDYLTKRYAAKQQTMQDWLTKNGYQLIIHIPVGTEVPEDQKSKIQKDNHFWMEK
jgi:hypothetical protein